MSDNEAVSESTVELSSDWAEQVLAFIRPASRRSLDWYRSGPQTRSMVENKEADGAAGPGHEYSFDPVTEADRLVEQLLRHEIEQRYPHHGIVGEEFGVKDGHDSHSWIIDPIDGTRAFIVGQPMWGTLVGLLDGGRPVAGWMHIPTLDETYLGVVGGGAPVARHVIHDGEETGRAYSELAVRETAELRHAILASTHPDMFDDERGGEQERFDALRSAVKMTRFGGDCLNYGLLAAGLIDLVVENGLASYDIAPLIPIIEAAGGVVTTLDGTSAAGGGYVVAAATPALHQAAVTILSGP